MLQITYKTPSLKFQCLLDVWFLAVDISGWLSESLASAYVCFLNSTRLALFTSSQSSRSEAEGRCRFEDISLCGWRRKNSYNKTN